jgi:hypothetical protein
MAQAAGARRIIIRQIRRMPIKKSSEVAPSFLSHSQRKILPDGEFAANQHVLGKLQNP